MDAGTKEGEEGLILESGYESRDGDARRRCRYTADEE